MSDADTLTDARTALERLAENYHDFDLGVFQFDDLPDSDEPTLLVGVNTENDECVTTFETWFAKYPHLTISERGRLDDCPAVEVRTITVTNHD